MGYLVINPCVEPYAPATHLAPRLGDLAGTCVGLWSNHKINTTALLDECEAILRKQHGVAETVRGTYNAGRVMYPEEWGDVDRCDAVILTHGD